MLALFHFDGPKIYSGARVSSVVIRFSDFFATPYYLYKHAASQGIDTENQLLAAALLVCVRVCRGRGGLQEGGGVCFCSVYSQLTNRVLELCDVQKTNLYIFDANWCYSYNAIYKTAVITGVQLTAAALHFAMPNYYLLMLPIAAVAFDICVFAVENLRTFAWYYEYASL